MSFVIEQQFPKCGETKPTEWTAISNEVFQAAYGRDNFFWTAKEAYALVIDVAQKGPFSFPLRVIRPGGARAVYHLSYATVKRMRLRVVK